MIKKALLSLVLSFGSSCDGSLRSGTESGGAIMTQRAFAGAVSETIEATGAIKVQTGAEVRVGSRLSGVVERLHVDIGDEVEAGELLAELDDRELRAAVAAAEARVEELQEQLVLAELLLQKNRSAGILPEAEIAILQEEAAASRARLAQARAQRDIERVRLSYTQVRAPIGGTVASVSTIPGETVAASFAAPTFLTIVDLARLEIHAYVDESDIGRVWPGQSAEFFVDAWPGVTFGGNVRTIYPKAEIVNNVVNYVALVDIVPQSRHRLRPEMTAHLRLQVERKDSAIVIPRTALMSEEDRYFVAVAQGAGWTRRQVELGVVESMRVEVTEGLDEGETFAVNAREWAARAGEAEQ